MAAHYGTAVVPARPRKPRDKAKVGSGGAGGRPRIIAKLRNRRFFSLAEINAAIRDLGHAAQRSRDAALGNQPGARCSMRSSAARSRRCRSSPTSTRNWKQCKVSFDYHVEVERHYYSVPYALLRETVWVRITARIVEVFHRGTRIAAHMRSSSDRRHTTVREHMPSSHRRYADWTPERIRRQAGEIGRNTATLIEIIMRERPHPEQGFRASIGIIRLLKSYGRDRLEAACGRALEIGARSFTSVQFDPEDQPRSQNGPHLPDEPAIYAPNIRGPATSIEKESTMLTHPTLDSSRH